MKKIFLLTLITVIATSSMALAFAPYESNSETVGAGRLENADPNKAKVKADLSKDTERAKDMLTEADQKTGKGGAYAGPSASSEKK